MGEAPRSFVPSPSFSPTLETEEPCEDPAGRSSSATAAERFSDADTSPESRLGACIAFLSQLAETRWTADVVATLNEHPV
ncbi:unnamed protein product [Vitrella brassicaformis CCMP3155]|uniref:Uncharacterized protein n=1 Tax=Vitrella brassicaformis (strain CCMP3155) TaxID=1169540 RepID=A0A0G4ERZ8_VITBC|nr:unnamed protein product [Vitrella brassicaformis CCMP3155]|eukprot:CEM00677.1 unnamed protein product [Vitrella brassicaformis CCMP3155]